MLMPTESSGNDVVGLLAEVPTVGSDPVITPKGPTGLLQALRAASVAPGTRQGLPTMDASTVGAGASLFDYDASLAVDLDDLGPML